MTINDYTNDIHNGDAFDVLPELPDESVHAVVTDPPYGLAFMGRDWDDFEPREYQEWCEEWAREVKRVLKPGGHLLAFSGNRTHHRAFVGVEDAGFEIRDTLTWHYGSGFPKASDVSKTIDKRAGAEREVVGEDPNHREVESDKYADDSGVAKHVTAPATDAAEKWDGWKTGLKPATEYVVMARKPFDGATVDCVLEHGTGALNIDGTRIEHSGTEGHWPDEKPPSEVYGDDMTTGEGKNGKGRYPSNVIFGERVAAELDEQVGESVSEGGSDASAFANGGMFADDHERDYNTDPGYGDTGGPSRYFKTISWDGVTKVLSGESTKDKIDCQLCNHTLATGAEARTKRTQAKQESSVATSATSNQSAEQTGEKNTPANNAGNRSKTTQAKGENTAQSNAQEKPGKSGKQSNVNTAENSSKPDQATNEYTAQSPASQRTSTENTSKQTGTTTTSNESEKSSKSNTTTTQSSERKSKQEQKQTENTPKASPVKSVELPAQIGTTTTTINLLTCAGCAEAVTSNTTKKNMVHGEQDSPKRYKYTSKASKSERTLDGSIENDHPTVKPQDLMEWLVKLVTREGQIVLDPFAGSGTTCKAAKDLSRQFIGIERQDKYVSIAQARCNIDVDDPSVARDDGQMGIDEL